MLPWQTGCKSHRKDKAHSPPDNLGDILPQRLLGKTGESITMLTLGGWHIGAMDEKQVEPLIETAMEGGIRAFDTAHFYEEGKSEERLGKYLTPKYRDYIFLASKTTATNAEEAKEHLETSLRRLQTDYLDLWQAHNISSLDDVNRRRTGKIFDLMLKAKEKGKARHIGFTGHTTYLAHLYVLDQTDVFETCMMPVNVADPSYESFTSNVLPELQKKNYGILAMKSFGGGGLFGGKSMGRIKYGSNPAVIPNKISVKEALHFVWSLPVSSLVLGNDNADMLRENIKYAKNFVTLGQDERNELISKVADIGVTGEMEWYKKKD